MISDKLTRELQAIIRDEYGRDLSFDEVAKIGNDLVVIFDTLAKINFRMKRKKS